MDTHSSESRSENDLMSTMDGLIYVDSPSFSNIDFRKRKRRGSSSIHMDPDTSTAPTGILMEHPEASSNSVSASSNIGSESGGPAGDGRTFIGKLMFRLGYVDEFGCWMRCNCSICRRAMREKIEDKRKRVLKPMEWEWKREMEFRMHQRRERMQKLEQEREQRGRGSQPEYHLPIQREGSRSNVLGPKLAHSREEQILLQPSQRNEPSKEVKIGANTTIVFASASRPYSRPQQTTRYVSPPPRPRKNDKSSATAVNFSRSGTPNSNPYEEASPPYSETHRMEGNDVTVYPQISYVQDQLLAAEMVFRSRRTAVGRTTVNVSAFSDGNPLM